jgi:hypothetical protein
MPHLSRLLAAICAITVILVSLPTDAGIGDKGLPLLNGQKTKLLYTVVGVADAPSLATSFHCTSTERAGGKTIQLGVEVFSESGTLMNDVTVGFGQVSVPPGETYTLSTRLTAAFNDDNDISTGDVGQGSARIIATSKNVLCSVMLVDAINNAPNSMVMLPVFRATKQGGM